MHPVMPDSIRHP